MAVTIPAAINLHTISHGTDARSRGVTGSPATGVKQAGNLPLTTHGAQLVNNTASSATGAPDLLHFDFAASPSRDVSTDTKVLVWTWQWNAPNRIQISDVANDGFCFRFGSGSGSPPSNYKHYQMGGNDTFCGKSQGGTLAMVMDLNDTSNESSGGTFDNTDVQTYGWGVVRFNLIGTATAQSFCQRAFLFDTEVDGSRPEFTGTGSDWDDLVDAALGSDYTDQITNDWVRKNGSIVNVYAPWQIGDGTTATTFDDNGFTINGPAHDDPKDPRFRLTSQAMRCAIRLRNNAADVVTLSGTYNYADSQSPDVDFNVSNASSIDLEGSTWIGRGSVLLGSSVSGGATWDRCGTVDATAGPDVDGSTFRAPTDDALLIDSAQTLTGLTFASYTGQVGLRINGGAGSFTVTLDNCTFDKTGTFEVENSGSGTITLALTNGSTGLAAGDVTNTGGGSIVISNTVTVAVTVLDDATGLAIATTGRVYIADTATKTQIMSAATNGSGVASISYNYGVDVPIVGWARELSLTGTDYEQKDFSGAITASGFSQTVRLTPLT